MTMFSLLQVSQKGGSHLQLNSSPPFAKLGDLAFTRQQLFTEGAEEATSSLLSFFLQ